MFDAAAAQFALGSGDEAAMNSMSAEGKKLLATVIAVGVLLATMLAKGFHWL